MGRPSKPYFKKTHNAWYSRINGKLVNLGQTKAIADATFHRLMLNKDKVTNDLYVAQLIDIYLDSIAPNIKPITWKSYQVNLNKWANHVSDILMKSLKPFHITDFMVSKKTWGGNTRHHFLNIVKVWSRWCKVQGYVERDPFEFIKNPASTRRKPPEKGAIEKVLDLELDQAFRDYLIVALQTGCRPGEMRDLAVEDIDLGERTAYVRGKEGRRKIALTDTAVSVLAPLCAKWKTGSVLRNTRGAAWNHESIRGHFRRACARAGVAQLVPYHMRGIFATQAIKNGVDSLTVSKLLGHKDLSIISKFYVEIDDEMLRKAADQATRPREPKPTPPTS